MAPITILEIVGDGVRVNSGPFIALLQKVGDRKMKIISINGKMRSGKSFMMSCFIQYLKSSQPAFWITDLNKEGGFRWRRGVDPETKGIAVYSEPLYVQERNGQQVALIFLDCQGAFDQQTTLHQNSLIFSFSSLLSSTFIYNIKEVITENEIQSFLVHLSQAVRAGCINSGSYKSFQQLIMLNRDVSSDYKFGHHTGTFCPGSEGRNLFQETFHPNVNSSAIEVIESRALIRQHYDDISIFALEYPGQGIRKDDLSNLNPDFLKSAIEFMQLLFQSHYLPFKLVNNSPVTGSQYVSYFTALAAVFNGNKLPKVDSIFQSVAETENRKVKEQALQFFTNKIKQSTSADHGMPPATLQSLFTSSKLATHANFNEKFIMGSQPVIQKFQTDLLTEMTACFENLKISNQYKLAAKQNADRLAAKEKETQEAIHRKRRQDEIAEQNRNEKEATKKQILETAQMHLDTMIVQLQEANGRLDAVNINNYYFYETVVTKHRNRGPFGIVLSPSYTTSQVRRFNDGRYNADLQAAQLAVQNAKESVQNAQENLQTVQMKTN